jgi:hypothetical protein
MLSSIMLQKAARQALERNISQTLQSSKAVNAFRMLQSSDLLKMKSYEISMNDMQKSEYSFLWHVTYYLDLVIPWGAG